MSLKKWFDQKWVDIGSKRKDSSYAPCGRSKLAADRKRKCQMRPCCKSNEDDRIPEEECRC